MKNLVLLIFSIFFFGCQDNPVGNEGVKNTPVGKETPHIDVAEKQEVRDTTPFFLEGYSFDGLDGTKFSFDSVKGKVLLLDFWGTWCGSCIKQHPKVADLANEMEGEAFQLIMVSTDKDIHKWEKFVKEKKWKGVHLNVKNDGDDNPLLKMVRKRINKNGKEMYTTRAPAYYLVDLKLNLIELENFKPADVKRKILELLE